MEKTGERYTTSRDGTPIAYGRTGEGPALVLVDGALCFRGFGPMGPLAELLVPGFAVHRYDRRGRGDSGDTQPYAVAREVEDLAAVIEAAGGSASVFGMSSGAGHFPHLDDPDRFARVLREFIAAGTTQEDPTAADD